MTVSLTNVLIVVNLDSDDIRMLPKLDQYLNFVVPHSFVSRAFPFRNLHCIMFPGVFVPKIVPLLIPADWTEIFFAPAFSDFGKCSLSNHVQHVEFSVKIFLHYTFVGNIRQEKAVRSFVTEIRFHWKPKLIDWLCFRIHPQLSAPCYNSDAFTNLSSEFHYFQKQPGSHVKTRILWKVYWRLPRQVRRGSPAASSWWIRCQNSGHRRDCWVLTWAQKAASPLFAQERSSQCHGKKNWTRDRNLNFT